MTKQGEIKLNSLMEQMPTSTPSDIKNLSYVFAEWFADKELRKRDAVDYRRMLKSATSPLKRDVIRLCHAMGVDIQAVFAKTRGVMEIATARQICILRVCEKHGEGESMFKMLGMLLRRDRATIRHSVKVAKGLRETEDRIFTQLYNNSKNVIL